MGCFLGGVVGVWLSFIFMGMMGLLGEVCPCLTPVCVGALMLWLNEAIDQFSEEDKEKPGETSTFWDGIVAGPSFFWGIIAIVMTFGLVTLAIKPIERAPKALRRQVCVMVVLAMSGLGLFQQVSGAVQALVSSPRRIDETSLHTVTPGQFITIEGVRGTRLNDDLYVLVVDRQLVLVSGRSADPSPKVFTGSTVTIPTSENVYGEIASELRDLRKENPDFDFPLFPDAMIETQLWRLSTLCYALVVVLSAGLLARLIRDAGAASWRPSPWRIPVGILLTIGGLLLLFLLEVEQRKAQQELQEFLDQVKPVAIDRVDPANNGQPVVLTGLLSSEKTIVDKPFGAKLQGKLSAYREVSMLQNEEVWSGQGDDAKVTGVRQVWSDEPIACPTRPNPGFPFKSEFLVAEDCRMGAFTIPRELVAELSPTKPVNPPLKMEEKLAKMGVWKVGNNYHVLKRNGRKGEEQLRVRYLTLEPAMVTVMGLQQGETVAPFIGKNGGEIFSIFLGNRPAAAAKAWREAGVLPPGLSGDPWLYRVPLSLLLWLGFSMLLAHAGSGTRTDSKSLLLAGLAASLTVAIFPVVLALI